MNPYLILVLVSIILGGFWSLFLDWLNMRNLSGHVPADVADVHPAATYKTSQEYAATRSKLAMWEHILYNLALLAFILIGGFGFLEAHTRIGHNAVLSGLTFIGAIVLVSEILGLPFDLMRTFVIEKRYGFNRTTFQTFVTDRVKAYMLFLLIGAPLLACFLWILGHHDPFVWLWCWAVVTGFSLAASYLAPTLIMPLFSSFTPLEDNVLRHKLEDVAMSCGFPLQEIFVMDGSRRSSKANAFFTGFGRSKRLVLYDTLLEKHPAEEVAAVVAHEIGHFRLRHISKGLAFSSLHMLLLLFIMAQIITAPGLYHAFGLTTMPVHAGLVFFLLLYSPITFLVDPVFNVLSRRHEFHADRFAAACLGSPEPLIAALKRISADSLTNLTPHPWYVFFHFSHPPLHDRVTALRHHKAETNTA